MLILQTLDKQQLEQALLCLHQSQPPQLEVLKALTSEEWQVLENLLHHLMWEREHSPVH